MVSWNQLQAVALCAALLSVRAAPSSEPLCTMGSQGINLWKLQQTSQNFGRASGLFVQSAAQISSSEFPAHYFKQPLDHFLNSSETFGQRYWFSTRHYNPSSPGPVFILDGGETSGEKRLPFLDTGYDILCLL
jgi:hypothetical protein